MSATRKSWISCTRVMDRPTKKQRKLEEEGQNPSDAEKQNRKHSPNTTFLRAQLPQAPRAVIGLNLTLLPSENHLILYMDRQLINPQGTRDSHSIVEVEPNYLRCNDGYDPRLRQMDWEMLFWIASFLIRDTNKLLLNVSCLGYNTTRHI